MIRRFVFPAFLVVLYCSCGGPIDKPPPDEGPRALLSFGIPEVVGGVSTAATVIVPEAVSVPDRPSTPGLDVAGEPRRVLLRSSNPSVAAAPAEVILGPDGRATLPIQTMPVKERTSITFTVVFGEAEIVTGPLIVLPPLPAVSYMILDILALGGARALNDATMVVGSLSFGLLLEPTFAFLWEEPAPAGGGLTELSDFPSAAFDISNTGWIAGFEREGNDPRHAVLWQRLEGTTEISTWRFGGPGTVAFGVNDDGVIVGAGPANGFDGRALRWQSRSDSPEDLGTLGGNWATAQRINRWGHVVGASTTADGARHPFMWIEFSKPWFPHGMMELPMPLGSTFGEALAINDTGGAVGYAGPFPPPTRALLWNVPQPPLAPYWESVNLVVLGEGIAFDINNSGQVVGADYEASMAWIWQNGVRTDLYSLIWDKSGWQSLTSARGINDNGEITGVGVRNNQSRPFLLRPISH